MSPPTPTSAAAPGAAAASSSAPEVCLQALAEEAAGSEADTPALLARCAAAGGPAAALAGLLRLRDRYARTAEVRKAQGVWISSLGWYLSRMFIRAALVAGVAGFLLLGPDQVTGPLTWGLLGAVVYHVLIQVLVPRRLAHEDQRLHESERQHRDELLARIAELRGERSATPAS